MYKMALKVLSREVYQKPLTLCENKAERHKKHQRECGTGLSDLLQEWSQTGWLGGGGQYIKLCTICDLAQ